MDMTGIRITNILTIGELLYFAGCHIHILKLAVWNLHRHIISYYMPMGISKRRKAIDKMPMPKTQYTKCSTNIKTSTPQTQK